MLCTESDAVRLQLHITVDLPHTRSENTNTSLPRLRCTHHLLPLHFACDPQVDLAAGVRGRHCADEGLDAVEAHVTESAHFELGGTEKLSILVVNALAVDVLAVNCVS